MTVSSFPDVYPQDPLTVLPAANAGAIFHPT